MEAKAAISDPDAVCRLLEERGAMFEEEFMHQDTYYSHPCRNYAATDEAVRVRTINRGGEEEVRITYKGPKLDMLSKTREEVEVVAIGRPGAEALMDRLRFKIVASVAKKRLFYSLPPLKITVDEVAGFGWFLEVETSAGKDWERARDGVLAFMQSIGCGVMERRSYLELLLEKNAGKT